MVVVIPFTTARVITIRFASDRAWTLLIIKSLQAVPDVYNGLLASLTGKEAADNALL